jgi:putative salt-induced outer membrane protein YdiY
MSLLGAGAGRAAEVTVKGTVLSGKIVDVVKGGVKMQTVYGDGTLTIPFADIEAIESDQRFIVLYGDDESTGGRLLGVEGGALIVGDAREEASPIPYDSIQSAQNEDEAGRSMAWLRRQLRYWNGNVSFGFDAKQATTDTTTIVSTWLFERRKKPWRFVTSGRYFYDIERQKGQGSNTLDNEIRGDMRAEYDLFDDVFSFGTASGEYDEVEQVSFRGIPKGGLGYRLFNTEKFLLQADLGAGWVYERYFGGDDNNYWTAVFGAETRYALPFGSTFRASAEYLPAVDDWTTDYLIRSTASISAPLTDKLSLQLAVYDEYDNSPAEDTERNEFKTSLSLGWDL